MYHVMDEVWGRVRPLGTLPGTGVMRCRRGVPPRGERRAGERTERQQRDRLGVRGCGALCVAVHKDSSISLTTSHLIAFFII